MKRGQLRYSRMGDRRIIMHDHLRDLLLANMEET